MKNMDSSLQITEYEEGIKDLTEKNSLLKEDLRSWDRLKVIGFLLNQEELQEASYLLHLMKQEIESKFPGIEVYVSRRNK